jgi:hypothetical protein
MVTAKLKAQTVSALELSKMVDKAVVIASKRLEIAVESKNIIHRWDLVGRILLDAKLAQSFSEDVAKQITQAGVPAVAATLIIKRQIIAGFIERSRLQAPMPFM